MEGLSSDFSEGMSSCSLENLSSDLSDSSSSSFLENLASDFSGSFSSLLSGTGVELKREDVEHFSGDLACLSGDADLE